jgi:hypothetical protein
MGRKGRIGTFACCLGVMALAISAASAPGHQTETNKGVSVTMHVTPDDEPVSGQSSRIIVSKVRAGRWSFSRKSCACYLRISDSSGDVVLNRKITKRTTRFTFPRATAYELVFTGRVKRGSKTKRFRVSFAIRAS